MMGKKMEQKMKEYQNALEEMSSEAVNTCVVSLSLRRLGSLCFRLNASVHPLKNMKNGR